MTDDRFRLTALDARRWDFGSALRGFDRARVHAFRDQVAEELETMARANQELETKVNNFLEQLRVFRDRDKALNEALVSAQQLRGEIRAQAEREAQLIIREARSEADGIVAAARADVERAEGDLQSLWRSRQAFLAQMRTLVERQATEVSAAEQVDPPVPFRTRAPSAAASNEAVLREAESKHAESGEAASDDSAPSAASPQEPQRPDAPARVSATLAGSTPPRGTGLTELPDVQDALNALKEALESEADGLDAPAAKERTGGAEQPVRPSMPTPSWLEVVSDDKEDSR